jgi:hypothetical protein
MKSSCHPTSQAGLRRKVRDMRNELQCGHRVCFQKYGEEYPNVILGRIAARQHAHRSVVSQIEFLLKLGSKSPAMSSKA